MIAIVNCQGNWFHTQKRGVNGAFLVLTVLQKENLPEATSSSITCSICTSSTFPSSSNSLSTTFPPSLFVSQTAFLFGLISSLWPRFILIKVDLNLNFSRTVASIVYLCLHRRVWVYPKKEVMVEWKMFSTEQSLRFPRISRIISIPFILRRLASETRPTICPAAISLSE